jgi:hypothetical protein
MHMPASKAQQKAVRKYKDANYDRLEITVPKGRRADLRKHAGTHGESLNSFVNRAIDETITRDASSPASEGEKPGGGVRMVED